MAKRVYFAFHYQDVIDFRANVVRNHNFAEGVSSAGYFDYSIWEETKKRNVTELKKLIHKELDGTSVTVVLIGSDTWYRRWVRYEIFESIKRGNQVLGIHINSIKGKDGRTKQLGYDPFKSLGIEVTPDGKTAKPTEWKDAAWRYYSDLEPYQLEIQPHPKKGQHRLLSDWCPAYEWVADNGYKNFARWISAT